MKKRFKDKKILMLLQSPFPPDIRLEKEIKSLATNDFNVTLLCNQFEKKKDSDFQFCDIYRIKAIFNNPMLNKIINFPFILNLRLVWYTISTYLKLKPEVIHVHDLPMMPFGIILKKLFNRKLVFDMHENYPEALKAYDKNIVERIIKNYKVALIFEQIALKISDLILVVTAENQERLIAEGVPKNKIKIVSNTVDITFFESKDNSTSMINDDEEISIIYTGRISKNRGLDTAIEAMRYLQGELKKPKLKIVGEGAYLTSLKKLTNQLDLNEFVEFIKWPGHTEIPSYIRSAAICIIPQPTNGHSDTTIPHKLFEYMLFNKPILTSDAKPLKRIVENTKCGETFRSNDPLDFAKSIMRIINSKTKYGQNGLTAVNDYYNWNTDSKVLIDAYIQLFNSAV